MRRRDRLVGVYIGIIAVILQTSANPSKRKLQTIKVQDQKLTSDPVSGVGLDELFAKGKALELDRDIAITRGSYFDYGQALLQIAIVLASVAIISGGNMLLSVSFALGGLGAIATVGGFTLAFPLPFAV